MRHLLLCVGSLCAAMPAVAADRFDTAVDRAAQGDAAAIRAIARQRPAADGARAEAIDAALSDALRTRPALVLSLLRADPALPRPDWLCQDRRIEPGAAEHRRFEAQAARAVAAVRDPSLRPLQDACLANLRATG